MGLYDFKDSFLLFLFGVDTIETLLNDCRRNRLVLLLQFGNDSVDLNSCLLNEAVKVNGSAARAGGTFLCLTPEIR